MQGTEQEPGEAHLSVGWQAAIPEPGDQSLERAAAYAAILTRTLAAAGYQPRRLDLGLRRDAHGILEIRLRGDVPRMPEPDFASLARVTLNAANLIQDVDGMHDVVLWATLEPDVADTPIGPHPARLGGRLAALPVGRLVIGLVLGLLLGVLGLPRLELPFLTPSSSTSPQPREVVVIQDVPTPARAEPTPVPALPTATIARAATATPAGPRVLLAERFASPLPNWPDNTNSSAWFGAGGFHVFARQPGRFAAIGVPLSQAVNSAVLSAEFHKVSGPPGGGYGLIVRDQGSPAERSSGTQGGQYMVLEVGDRGDVGIWQRNETRWIDVMPWTHSEAVHTDLAPNALTVTTGGGALRFEVNGQIMAELTYGGVPAEGGVGIFVGGDLNEVVLNSLRIEIS
jgi:hypothetical protein